MKTKFFIGLLIAFSVVVFGCAQTQTDSMEKKDTMMDKDAAMEKPITSGDNAEPGGLIHDVEGNAMEKFSYTGQVLAGTEATKYLDFNKEDYDKALKEKKKILLYFYASWCPICKREQVDTFAAFNELNDPDLIGFRVNYRDGDDDADEKALAQEFGVGYQHTKVILKDGQRVGKWPDSWDKQRYLGELAKI